MAELKEVLNGRKEMEIRGGATDTETMEVFYELNLKGLQKFLEEDGVINIPQRYFDIPGNN